MRNFFSLPELGDKESTAKAQIFFKLVSGTALIVTLILAVELFVLPENFMRWVYIAVAVDLVAIVLVALNRKGFIVFASHLFAGFILTMIFVLAWSAGGIRAPAIQEVPVIVLGAGLMLGWKKGAYYAAAAAAASAGLVLAERAGYLPPAAVVPTSTSVLVNSVLQVALLVLLQYLIVGNLNKTLSEAKEEVSRRTKAEEAWKESESRFQGFIEQAPVAIIVSRGGKGVYVNKKFAEMMGLKSVEEAVGRPIIEYYAPQRRKEREERTRQRLIGHPVSSEFESIGLRTDGTQFPVQVSVAKHQLRDGEVYIAFVVDISERTKTEEKLRFERMLLRTLIDNIPDSIYSKDILGRKTLANDAEVRNLRMNSEADIIGKTDYDFYPKELADGFTADDQRVLLTGQAVLNREEFILDEKGEKRWLLTSKLPLKDVEGRIIGLAGIGHDNTEHRRAEDQLRKLSLAIEQSQASVIITDIRGTIEYVNPKFTQVTGYTLEDVLGKNPRILKSGETSDEQYRKMWETISAGKAWRGEFHNRKKNGELFWEMASISPVKDQDNLIINFVAVKEDITERKQVDEALRNAQKLESIGTLAGGIAHDFNNLLNAILGQSTLAINKLPKENPAKSHIEKTIKAAERAADLTRHLLAYSGKGKFITEEIDVNRLVNENVQILEISVPKSVRLRYDLCVPSPHIKGDVAQIQQVIMNLIINAGEAITPNPGIITVRSRCIGLSENDIAYWKYTNTPLVAGTYASLQVIDTGQGMKPEVLARIFDPFFTTKFTGRGLGLAAVLGIVRGHNGGLRIESKEGKGTEFEVVFPLIQATPSIGQKPMKAAAVVNGTGKTVLIIDDEPSVLELLNDVFSDASFKVMEASNPVEGIDLYRRNERAVDLVVLDYSMPGMDGKAAFEELVRINKDVVVILCSGYTEEEIRSTFDGVRPRAFVQKPYKPSQFLGTVAKILKIDGYSAG